ncbi:MAG: SDR family NAD(P)-dependent oxidoreductase, partial [Pseudomonadota bacterium]
YEVLQWLAAQMGVDSDQVETPAAGGAKRLSNARMLDSGFTLRYPDYVSGYSSLLATESL